MRITAPLLALIFGLAATWFGYRLNLESDLARHFRGMRIRADSNGRRLARLSEELLAKSQRNALEDDLKTRVDASPLKIVGIVDQSGRIVADSTGKLRGQPAAATPLAVAAALINRTGEAVVSEDAGTGVVISAHPFRIGEDNGWVLLEFDLIEGIAAARADAVVQLGWMTSAMALLSFILWAVLYFGFAARLGRLANGVLAFGEGRTEAPPRLSGGDEVGNLSRAISTMAAKLRERAAEQVRLEREVLEISESERRRIGHDLHDSLGQRLTAASMTTNALIGVLKKDAPALVERGEDIGRQLREGIAEVRSLSHGLAPVALVDDGLMAALTSLAETATRGGGTVRCVFECREPVRVANAEVAGQLYRIAQEAVNNALKHATPSEIRIALECRDRALVLEVDDDGGGFDGADDAGDGIGMRVMRYRARLIGGDLRIASPAAGGTRISCRVELPA